MGLVFFFHAENYLDLVSPGRIVWLYSGSSSAAGEPLDVEVDHLSRLVLKSSYWEENTELNWILKKKENKNDRRLLFNLQTDIYLRASISS